MVARLSGWFFGILLLAANAQAGGIVFSTSGDAGGALAGSQFNLVEGQSGSLYVWVSTPDDVRILGMGLDILSSNSAVLEATSHTIFNPGGRWLPTGIRPGTLGDLVTGSGAVSFSEGIATGGGDNYLLYSRVDFLATGIGQTDLSFAENSFQISNGSISVADRLSFGTGMVTVAAIPEPISLALLAVGGLVGGRFWIRRRRSAVCAQ